VVTGLASGANVASAQDKRDSIVAQLAQQIGVATTTAPNGSMSIYTDSGVTLFQDTPRTVSFTASPTLVDGMSGSPVTVDGVPITGANSPMPIQSGALAGYAALRDTIAPQYESQLDQIAGGLINAFADSDQSNPPTLPSLPGLFTTAGATSLPSMSSATGLAAAIVVNPNVDPSQGGNATLLRDGGISNPGNPAYTYNTTGSASYTGRLQQLAGAIDATQSFDPSAGLGASAGLADYANASVSWLQGQNQQASNASAYQNALVANSGATLQTMGQSALQGLIASTNATSGDQYVFGGINSSVAPMANYFSTPTSAAKTAVDNAFQTAFGVLPTDPAAAAITPAQMQTFLSGPFAALFSGANWTSDWSSASSTNTTAEIAPGQTVTTSTNANQPGFQQLAQAYTMLSEFGGSQLSASAQQAVASAAESLIAQGQASLTNAQAELGPSQSAVTDANNSMGSQLTILQQQVDNVDNVNQDATAAKITSLTTQIQMAYELTARIQQLNLAQYLPVP
jgi:hypothetical protein